MEIISDKLSDGKKPPPETRVIVRFRELKSLIPEIFNNVKKIKHKLKVIIRLMKKKNKIDSYLKIIKKIEKVRSKNSMTLTLMT